MAVPYPPGVLRRFRGDGGGGGVVGHRRGRGMARGKTSCLPEGSCASSRQQATLRVVEILIDHKINK
jgi:hypothetical protein